MSVNSFTQTTNDLVNQVNIALASMQGMNETMTTQQDSVTVTVEGTDPVTGDPCTYTYSMPSYQYVLNRLDRVSRTMDAFVSGEGVVLLNDGTFRKVTTTPVARAPQKIEEVGSPTRFGVKSNWFFESLMFPNLYVRFDLKGKVDDRSDRVVIKRIIFDNFDSNETQWFKDTFIGQEYTYAETLDILNANNKRFWEDQETKFLPVTTRPFRGEFVVTGKSIIQGKEWFFLDTLNYSTVDDLKPIDNLEVKIGDKLRYENSLYKIEQIEVTEKRVQLLPLVGLANLTVGNVLEFYSVPFENKFVDVEIGYNECQSVFIKGVNDDFNVIGDEWSDSISFYTNDLVIEGGSTTLESYYFSYVSDFGKIFEGQAKERPIPAYYGVKPAAPFIASNMFAVKQINRQLNAALDREEIKKSQTQIESTKTIINSLKNTIAQQKSELVELTDPAQRADLQGKIDSNISQLSKKTIEYQSLVKSLSTLAYENDAVFADPKYRVRGFFPIPKGAKITEDPTEPPQEIIQFEVAYRYLRLDNTGNPLENYLYEDPCTGQRVTGTYAEWNIIQSPIKERVFDEQLDRYVWKTEDIANGEDVNINQIDIPIRKGEKVEIKVRSISEAGWPMNPMKSDWSEPVIIEFPPNLEGSDQVANILSDATAEESQIKLDETLSATGVITHLQDGFPNPNAADGTYFKHRSRFIEYNLGKKDIDGNVTEERSIDLQSQISGMTTRTYITVTKPSGSSSSYANITATLQQLLQVMVDRDPSIYDNLQMLLTT